MKYLAALPVIAWVALMGAAPPAATPTPKAPAATLGLDAADVPAQYPARYHARGAYVVHVTPGGPAEAARVLPGDVIVAVAGQPVRSVADLRTRELAVVPGSDVTLAIVRYGKPYSLRVAAASDDALFANVPLCEPREVTGQLAEAHTAIRRRDDDNVQMHAARALDLAEVCTALQPRYDEWTLLRVAEGYELLGAADADRGERDLAADMFGNAWTIDRLIPTAPVTSGEGRAAAAAQAAAIARRDPAAAGRGDDAIVSAVSYGAVPLGPSPFSVVKTWVSQGPSFGSFVHLRVTIDAAHSSMVYAGFFCIKTGSTDVGTETFYALSSAAGDTVRGHTQLDKAQRDVAPEEDLGALGHVYLAANTPVTYVLTFDVTDRLADLHDVAASLAYAPN